MTSIARPLLFCCVWVLALGLGGCASRTVPAPYPHESILTVIAELKLSLQQDPYRWPPGRDLEGRNIYRVTLARLDSIGEAADPQYRDVFLFARAECRERLGDWSGARQAFEEAAALETSLAAEGRRRAELAGRMGDLTDRARFAPTLDGYVNDLDVAIGRLGDWLAENPAGGYPALIRQEIERAQIEKAELLFANRHVLKDGAARAIAQADELVKAHPESYRRGEHLLLLGSYYEALGRDWVAEHRPDGLEFQPEGPWPAWIGRAREAYAQASQADGDPAKLEAQARLRALDAYALRIKNLAQ